MSTAAKDLFQPAPEFCRGMLFFADSTAGYGPLGAEPAMGSAA